jgi:hypothetical protein
MVQTPTIMWVLDQARPSVLGYVRMILEGEPFRPNTLSALVNMLAFGAVFALRLWAGRLRFTCPHFEFRVDHCS